MFDISYYLQQHLLARVATDYGLDHSELVGRYLSCPPPPPTGPKVHTPVAPSVSTGPKPRRKVVWDSTRHCHGTKNNGTRCCSVRVDGTEFCRHHQGQREHPVPLAPVRATDDDIATVQSFSVHTPAHSRRPSFSATTPPSAVDPEAQRVFEDIAHRRVGCGHLLKKVVLPVGGYTGISLPTADGGFDAEPMFRQMAETAGLTLQVVDGHLIPHGYIEPTVSSVEQELDLQGTVESCCDAPDDVDEVSSPVVLDYDTFMAMADAVGLDDDVDPNCSVDDAYYSFGLFITSVDDNVKQLRKMLADEGYETTIEEVADGEEYMFITKK
jgi:hypothetical protein